MAYTAVAYHRLYHRFGNAAAGLAFGPEFQTADEAWRWLHDLGDTPCDAPPHDFIEVEPLH